MSPPGIKGVLFTVKISHAELLFTETLINTLKSSEARQILDLKCLFVQSQFFMRVKNVSCNVWVTVDTEGTRMEASLSPWRLSPSEDMTGKNLKPLLQCCNVCTWMNLSGFVPWVGKIPWRRKWQSSLVFLPGESHGQRSLAGYRPCGCRERNTAEQLSTQPKMDVTFSASSMKRVVVGGSARWGCSKVDVDRWPCTPTLSLPPPFPVYFKERGKLFSLQETAVLAVLTFSEDPEMK